MSEVGELCKAGARAAFDWAQCDWRFVDDRYHGTSMQNKNIIKGGLARVFALAILFATASPAMASWCTSESGMASMNVDLGTVTEASGNPVSVGTVIYTKTGAWDAFNGHNAGWCKSSPGADDRVQTNVNFTMPGTPVPGFTGVYPTNLQGVGVRISIWSSRSYYGTPTTPTYIPLSLTANLQNDVLAGGPAYGTGYLQIEVEVIKTASNWQAGPLSFVGGQLSVAAADGASNTVVYTQVNISGTMNTRTCSVDTASNDMAVEMGTTGYPTGFSGSGPGSYGPTKPFQISMSCASGPRTSIRFDPVLTVQGYPNIIGIAPGPGSAASVGVQLLNSNGIPVALGAPVLLTAQAPNGINTFSFGARYSVIDAAVKGGEADAVAMFTMVYE